MKFRQFVTWNIYTAVLLTITFIIVIVIIIDIIII